MQKETFKEFIATAIFFGIPFLMITKWFLFGY